MGDTKISWLKSCSRSINSEMTPIALDCQIVCARIPMKMSGNEKSATIRVRSRRSLTKSRWASVRTAESSLTRLRHDLQVRVFERRRVRAHQRERRVDGLQRGVRAARVDVQPERPIALRADLQSGELLAKPRAIVRVDQDVLLDELGLDALRRTEGHDLPLIDDADRVGLLGLLEVVRGEEDRRSALASDRSQVIPERAP